MNKTFESINEQVTTAGGVKTFSMEELREAKGAKRLGNYVVEAISEELAQHGLGHFPEDLPQYQHQCVRVYRKGTAVGRLIDAITSVCDNVEMQKNEKNDEIIRQVSENDAQEVLHKIKQLVCE